MTKKRQEQYEKLLTFLQPDVWYKASDLMNVLGVKETRTKNYFGHGLLLKSLWMMGQQKENDIRGSINIIR